MSAEVQVDGAHDARLGHVPAADLRPAPTGRPRRDLALLVAVIAVGAALRLGYSWGATGMFYPDDLFQSLEPAHGIVYGIGLRFWEFDVGARPWTVPGVYVILLALLKLLGVTAPAGYTLAARLLNAAIAATWPYLCWRIGRAVHSRRAGLIAAALSAGWYLLVLLAPRALSHAFSLTFALWAMARVAEEPPHPAAPSRRAVVTGALLGLAIAFRYQEALVLIGVVSYVALRRRGREIPGIVAGAAGPLVLLALLDWATWGAPGHSVVAYLKTNLLEGRASGFGRMPWHFYLGRLAAATGAGAAVLGLGAFAGRRALLLAGAVAGPILVAHAAIPHKELRFVLGAVLLLLVVAACGAATVATRLAAASGRPRVGALVTALVLILWTAASAATATSVTFADLGLYRGLPEARERPWGFRRDVNRALARVGARPDLCGVALFPYGPEVGGSRLATTGGYTWLHRGVPMVVGQPPPGPRSLVNYVVACAGAEPAPRFADLEHLEQIGTCAIYRRARPVACPAAVLEPFSHEWRWGRSPQSPEASQGRAPRPSAATIPSGALTR